MPTILVTGGCGFIGRHLVAALRARGARVRVLDLAEPGDVPSEVEFRRGSILDAQCLRSAMEQIEQVYHLAGIAKLWTRDKADFGRINAGGTEMVMQVAAEQGVRRVVHCSTEAILLPKRTSGGAAIDEGARPDFSDMPGPYTRSKHQAEQAVQAAVRRGLDAVIVNPTVPIGADDRNLTPPAAMLAMFLSGKSPAYLDCVLNLVDVRDVTAGMVLAAERGRTGERYILGGENLALRDLLTLLEQTSGRAMPKLALPGVARFGVGGDGGIARRLDDAPAASRYTRRCAACAAFGAFRQQQGAQRTWLQPAASAGMVWRRLCGGCWRQTLPVVDATRSSLRRPARRIRACQNRARGDRGSAAAHGIRRQRHAPVEAWRTIAWDAATSRRARRSGRLRHSGAAHWRSRSVARDGPDRTPHGPPRTAVRAARRTPPPRGFHVDRKRTRRRS